MKKQVLVTGGAGFIGSHLCRKLLKRNNKVIVIDNLYSSSIDNIKELLTDKNFTFIEADINTIKLDTDKFSYIKEIYHLACPASPKWYQLDPIFTTKTCVIGTINILELAKRTGAKILFTSTSEIYGDPPSSEHPQKESYFGNVNPISVRSCYDEAKRCAESLFFDYYRQHKIDIKIVRIFNCYGSNLEKTDGRVVSNFIVQALSNNPITIYGDGTQTRSFQYVDDLIRGLTKMMASRNFTGPVNIGNPKEFTMLELAELVIKLTNSKSKIEFKPLPLADPKQRKPDISLALLMLNWKPKIQLEEGLIKTIEYFRKIIK